MNKFHGPDDPGYKEVGGKIQSLLATMRKGTTLDHVDAWIRDKHYTSGKLRIERLSGARLLMDRCYVNLAIIKEPDFDIARPGESATGGWPPQLSAFSLGARLKTTTPDKSIQVDLAALFEPREGPDGQPKPLRRILIRGRAGVGKTTLCKKIVHDFTRGTWSAWSDLFDRVLWVPLRTLKLPERQAAHYSPFDLFHDEFFSTLATGMISRRH